MGSFGIKYASLLGGMMLLFVNFVACGTQMYQVSMKGDHGSRLPSAESPGSKDPASPMFGLHAPNGWRKVPIEFELGDYLALEQRKGLMRAMNTWEVAVGRKLFSYKGIQTNVTGNSFNDLYSSLDDFINGHYLDDDWGKTAKPQVVLATTIWNNEPSDAKSIRTADIRFNSQHYLIGDALTLTAESSREVVDMQTLALHELGHLLGLTHVDPVVDGYSIMKPSLFIGEGLTQRNMSRGDLERIQKVYGCAGEACDLDKTLARIDRLMQADSESESGSDSPKSKKKGKNALTAASSVDDEGLEYPDFHRLIQEADAAAH